MSRTEFVQATPGIRAYRADGLGWAMSNLGGGIVRIALPCACGDPDCEGWAMLSAEAVLDHLGFRAPDALRAAYIEAIEAAEGNFDE